MVDFEDITAVVEKFQSDPDAPIKSRADLINSNVTDPEPDRKVDFTDITFCVDAFRGFSENPNSYPGPNLGDFDCPPYYGDCYADIRVDSNNDGVIDDFDEAVEDTMAMFVVVNSDDDNLNEIPDMGEAPVEGEDDLAEIQLTAACDDVLPELAWWSLSWDPPDAPVKVWFDPEKSGSEVANGYDGFKYEDYWPPPESVWLETLDTFDDAEFTFTFDPGTGSLRDLLTVDPAQTTQNDTIRTSAPCTRAATKEQRWWVGGQKVFDYGGPPVTMVSGHIHTRSVSPLCGEQGNAKFPYETVSAAFVSSGMNVQVPPLPVFAIWAETGYMRRRTKNSSMIEQGVFAELVSGTGQGSYQFRIFPLLLTGGDHKYAVVHTQPGGPLAQSRWSYILDEVVFAEFSDEIWDILTVLDGNWQASWNGEVTHDEDKLAGEPGNNHCHYTLCIYEESWSTYHPADFTAANIDYYPKGHPQHPGATEFGKQYIDARSFDIWDVNP